MLKFFLALAFIVIAGTAFSQSRHPQMVSIAYEGGMVTHPGISAGYLVELENFNAWTIQVGAKMGFYYHRRYQTGVFLLPLVQVVRTGEKGRFIGFDFAAGKQRIFIHNAYEVRNDGSVSRDRSAGQYQWVFSPGLRFGRDLSFKRPSHIQWFMNPQLQFRYPANGRKEKYFLMGAGINYKL